MADQYRHKNSFQVDTFEKVPAAAGGLVAFIVVVIILAALAS